MISNKYKTLDFFFLRIKPIPLKKGGSKMKFKYFKMLVLLLTVMLMILPAGQVFAAKPIVLGCPLSTAFLYGWAAERGIQAGG